MPHVFKAFDLYCGAGGAARGLADAGFEVVGCDIMPQPNFPFKFVLGNALDADLSGFDFVWASPPCQAHTTLRHLQSGKSYECFIERTRAKLKAWGGPYVIENVPKAPLISPVTLCGSYFGLGVRRHRIFESNVPIIGTECRHASRGRPIDVSGTGSRRVNPRSDGGGGDSNKPRNLEEARLAMGIPWMTRKEISQAIPPAYGRHIGAQIASWLERKVDGGI